MNFSQQFLNEARQVIDGLGLASDDIEHLVQVLADARDRGGRLFILGVGGSAANAAHAVNDFRKIVGMETYSPTDNIAELTARTNDEGWDSFFTNWLKASRLKPEDCVLVLSVGGGSRATGISANLANALDFVSEVGAPITGIVGRDGGQTAKTATACVVIPTVNPLHVTPHSEAFQGIVWHLIVSHPKLKQNQTRWESVAGESKIAGSQSPRNHSGDTASK